MPIYSTSWADGSINSTNYLGDRANESITKGSPIGLLLSLTQAQSIDSPVYDYSTDWTNTTINSTNWTED